MWVILFESEHKEALLIYPTSTTPVTPLPVVASGCYRHRPSPSISVHLRPLPMLPELEAAEPDSLVIATQAAPAGLFTKKSHRGSHEARAKQ